MLHVTGISRSTLYELSSRNAFPARVPLGGKNVAWVESEIHYWVAERIAARRQEDHA
ncbi:helix-turn-helix transcriptional regulator [Dickeya dadantii subsp. dieffenbachiae]|uniref:helix-turn-helix transcriptional regulator n=1 Tax=Dickeya dadantii TaxID=204038 RepID=UPI00039F54C8|nr:AlpA family phage regulatory protein [Dickeya dadantii]